jgi:hypothetical protein
MRLKIIIGLAALVASFGLAGTEPAEAGWYRRAPAGYGTVQTVRHWGYYPRYNHVYSVDYVTDPYAYRYEPRGYYPYYNSGYWRPAAEVRWKRAHRYNLVQPPYYRAWGYPKRHYQHRRWHAEHHGLIRREHW